MIFDVLRENMISFFGLKGCIAFRLEVLVLIIVVVMDSSFFVSFIQWRNSNFSFLLAPISSVGSKSPRTQEPPSDRIQIVVVSFGFLANFSKASVAYSHRSLTSLNRKISFSARAIQFNSKARCLLSFLKEIQWLVIYDTKLSTSSKYFSINNQRDGIFS